MSARAPFRFRLYVAGDAPNSAQAIANLHALCHAYLPGRHQVEIVDVLRAPGRALVDGVFMTPTLLKLSPGPARRIVGTLAATQLMVDCLGLQAAEDTERGDDRPVHPGAGARRP